MASTAARTIDLASIVARNLAPIAGLVLLGWNATHMALLYYIDTVVSIASLVLLLFLHGTDMPIDLSTAKGKAAVVLAVAVLAGVYAAVFAWPVIVMFGMSGVETDLADRAFLGGLAGQLFAACTSFVTTNRQLRGRGADREALIKSRFGIVTLRWVAVLAISMVAPFAVVIVAAYSAASVYWELKPPK
jgi:hypothetical protein